MTTPSMPRIDCEQLHATLVVTDILAAAEFYTKKLAFTWGEPPTFADVNLDGVQIFLEQGEPNPKGCSVYFVLGQADELYEFHRANGVEIVHPPVDQPYGIRDYRIRDLHGYLLAFGHRIASGEPQAASGSGGAQGHECE